MYIYSKELFKRGHLYISCKKSCCTQGVTIDAYIHDLMKSIMAKNIVECFYSYVPY